MSVQNVESQETQKHEDSAYSVETFANDWQQFVADCECLERLYQERINVLRNNLILFNSSNLLFDNPLRGFEFRWDNVAQKFVIISKSISYEENGLQIPIQLSIGF